jgi:transcriptional repressor NrdR
MVKYVIKRKGKKEAFRPAKLKRSIAKAARDAHIPAARAKRIAGKVSRLVLKSVGKRKAVATSVLRKKILSKLDKVEPKAAKAWRKYDKRRRARKRK